MKTKGNPNLPKIGYLYHYPRLDHPTDKFRLDIFISANPTEKHFDVLRLILPVRDQKGKIELIKVTHPWEHDNAYQACAGVLIMEDRKGKKEEAFIFGGELKIFTEGNLTQSSLVSSAPIIKISGANPVNELYVEELEIILAKQRAAHGPDAKFEGNLCSTPPQNLYLACLREIRSKLKHSSVKSELSHQLLIFLQAEEHRLFAAGLVQESTVTLADIFG